MANLNSAGNKHAAPVQMQVYYLRDYIDFKKASFFDIYDLPRKTLGTDFIKKTDKIIVPGTEVTIPLNLTNDVAYVGLLTAFTQLRSEEDWRFVIPVEQLGKIKSIVLTNNEMTIELVDSEDPIILGKPEVIETPESEGGSFSLDDMKKKSEDIQSAKDSFSPDKLKEKYTSLDPRNPSK
jgi:type VI secretion system VasD/TssJ family lipoprotein